MPTHDPATVQTVARAIYPEAFANNVEWSMREAEVLAQRALSAPPVAAAFAALAEVRALLDDWEAGAAAGDSRAEEAATMLAAALSPTPTDGTTSERSEALNVQVGFQFQDGEVIKAEQMSNGIGIFQDEEPMLVLRASDDDEWESRSDFALSTDPFRQEPTS